MKNIVLKTDGKELSSANEAFKSLRANVQFCGPDVKVIVVTSCLPDDGKSTVSIGLGITLAQAGKKVLVVDADLRKSIMLTTYSDEVGVVGFSEFLSGQASLPDVKFSTQVSGLDMIFSGQYPANPAELLSSSAFKNFIEDQKAVYDYIIVDTPPLGVVVDAAVIASVCDSAILVVPENKIRYGLAKNIKAQLEKSGARIIGVVLNKHENRKKHYGYYSRYYSYGRKY